jgi:F0F1-type ATP synthase delta subunit
MAGRLSRRALATFVAKELLAGNDQIIDWLAALLIEERREREADLLVRDIESILADSGQMIVQVDTARPLDAATKQEIESMFDQHEVHIKETVRPELIGGVKITTPTQSLDRTIAKKLEMLRTAEI